MLNLINGMRYQTEDSWVFHIYYKVSNHNITVAYFVLQLIYIMNCFAVCIHTIKNSVCGLNVVNNAGVYFYFSQALTQDGYETHTNTPTLRCSDFCTQLHCQTRNCISSCLETGFLREMWNWIKDAELDVQTCGVLLF